MIILPSIWDIKIKMGGILSKGRQKMICLTVKQAVWFLICGKGFLLIEESGVNYGYISKFISSKNRN